MQSGERIAEFLLDIGAIRLSVGEPFTWASGIKSPIYCDNRMIYSHPDARRFVVDLLVSHVRSLHVEPDVVAGTATAAIGWGALVADKLGLPFVYVRSKLKDHGTQKRIEGDLRPDRHVVLIEDLISTGGSSVSAVKALREEGKAVVTDVIALFTYELLAAREKALEANVMFHPLSTIGVLVRVALSQDRISEGDVKEILRFLRDPQGWKK